MVLQRDAVVARRGLRVAGGGAGRARRGRVLRRAVRRLAADRAAALLAAGQCPPTTLLWNGTQITTTGKHRNRPDRSSILCFSTKQEITWSK